MGLFNHFPQSKGLEGTPLGAYVFSINVVQRAGLFTGADQLGAERQDRKVLCRLPGFNREKLTFGPVAEFSSVRLGAFPEGFLEKVDCWFHDLEVIIV